MKTAKSRLLILINSSVSILPYLLFTGTVSNIFYLSLLSILPEIGINNELVNKLHILLWVFSILLFKKYYHYFKVSLNYRRIAYFIPYLIIALARFPLIYPTYDDLAAHFIYGDYANNFWRSSNFMPMNFLNYFYLVIDLNYTPFLFTIGVRATILLFYTLVSIWMLSIYVRIRNELKMPVQKHLVDLLFIVVPFIPHLMAIHGTLMLDYITLAMSLETIYLFIKRDSKKTFAMLMGITTIFVKQSSSTFIFLIIAYYAIKNFRKIKWGHIVIYGLFGLAYFVRLYFETGNPIFGLFNGLFQSSLYHLSNFRQTLFGPQNFLQLTVWPIIGQFTKRYGEGVVAPYAIIFFSFIPIVGYLLSIYLFVKRRSLKYGLIIVSYILWSYFVGYSRYYIPLNIITLILLIEDINLKKLIFISKYKKAIFLLVFLMSLSSMKTDFSWRPFPSVRTVGANKYYLEKYRDGLKLFGRDNIKNMANNYRPIFNSYKVIVPVNRGPVSFLAYLGYINGMKVIDGVSNSKYNAILNDEKISDTLKDNLTSINQYNRALVIVEKQYLNQIDDLYVSNNFNCEAIGSLSQDPYFQRKYFFENVYLFSCLRIKS